jgi:hypothetical protein
MHTCWLDRCVRIITFWGLWTLGSCQCTAPEDVTRLDFEESTNPSAGFEWMDAAGVVHTAADDSVPAGASDTQGGAFPGGNIRFTNVGATMGVGFDLLVTTLPGSPYLAASNVAGLQFDVAYATPPAPYTQGLLVKEGGYGCFGALSRRMWTPSQRICSKSAFKPTHITLLQGFLSPNQRASRARLILPVLSAQRAIPL